MKPVQLDYQGSIIHADRVKWEQLARRNNWPVQSGPLAMGCIIWAALRRVGLTHSEYEQFIDNELVDYAEVDDEGPDDFLDNTPPARD